MTLVIHITPNGTDMELAAFPFNDGQYIESETPRENEVLVSIDLGEYTDTTTAQEQYLNTNPNVASYGVYD